MKDFQKRSAIILHGKFDSDFFDDLKRNHVKNIVVLEGRPNFETSQSIVAQLLKRNMKPTLISDNMAGTLFAQDLVKEVWLSYEAEVDGGFLCRAGGLILAVLGKRHKVPVKLHFIAENTPAFGNTNDLVKFNGVQVAPAGVKTFVPLLDKVPKKYVKG